MIKAAIRGFSLAGLLYICVYIVMFIVSDPDNYLNDRNNDKVAIVFATRLVTTTLVIQLLISHFLSKGSFRDKILVFGKKQIVAGFTTAMLAYIGIYLLRNYSKKPNPISISKMIFDQYEKLLWMIIIFIITHLCLGLITRAFQKSKPEIDSSLILDAPDQLE